MEKDKAKELLDRYSKGQCTEEEKALVETYYNLHQHAAEYELTESELLEELDSIAQTLPVRKRPVLRWPLVAAAAAILLLALAGWWLYIPSSKQTATDKQPVVAAAEEVIQPGGNKAILTLANGQKISLTDAGNGTLANEAGIRISKTADGQMVYHIEAMTGTGKAFNTIETPVGGQYQVQLPDGSRIWLNSKSYLRFPLHFTDTERRVEVEGEAYFEVAHDQAKPFRVVSRQQTIEVLGTHFNLNAYDDEAAVRTTLLEGAVKVIAADKQALLKPGQQAVLSKQALITRNEVLTDDIVSWKNNKIQFTDTDIHTIMRMLARWYNIEVSYAGRAINTTFGGSVSRSKNIDAILKVLETTGDVHFKIEGRRITVMP